MFSRRTFLKDLSATGIFFTGCELADTALHAAQSEGYGQRKEARVGGQRILTVDTHTHCYIPEMWDLLKGHDELSGTYNATGRTNPLGGDMQARYMNLHNIDARLAQMDERGIDVSVLSFNPPNWYWADLDLARQVVRIANESLAKVCAAHRDRLAGYAAVALQHPDLAAEQLEEGIKKFGMKGALIGASVNGEELSNSKFHPFWDKAEELQALIFIHPQRFPIGEARFKGKGNLLNVIGNPLETTVALSHLVLEGTLDRFPKLKILAAHAGGYLPSYSGRTDQCFVNGSEDCKMLKKAPSEYLKQLYYDTLVFTNEGLRHLIAEVGVSQIMLGTDGPGGWDREAVDFVLKAPSLSDSDRRAILGETAAKLLRIGA
jgi:aminocarboxymuconate-semialdehyde decarboxylase